MKKSIVLTVALLLAFAVPVFCEEGVVSAAKSSPATTTVAPAETIAEEIEGYDSELDLDEPVEEKTEQVVKVKKGKKSSAAKTAKTKKDSSEAKKSESKKIFNYSNSNVSNGEIEIKVGRTLNAEPEIDREAVEVDDVYTAGIEILAYVNSFVGLGIGAYNIFDSELKKDGAVISGPDGEYKVAFTNTYLTLKSKALQFNSDIIRNVYIYGQIGYGFMRIENAFETEDGLYWGAGCGIDIWHFLLDVNYATNFGKIKTVPGSEKTDVRQTTIIVSVGYRFTI
ncbi:MAG: outer membrane beta-barrel protein [Elusimicrobia bacterium]|nr:outer membrane beta-barrel protein [Elusimicrobiota bacterium]